jgi:hypothetical protein
MTCDIYSQRQPKRRRKPVSTIDYTQSKAVVAGIQQRLDETVAGIRSNKSLNEAGRRREIARATIEARKRAAKQKAAFVAEREQQRDAMRRIAFGNCSDDTNGSDLIATRDARDRAEKLETPEAAQKMLDAALLHSDEPLAKAVAARAHSRGWREVVDHYSQMFDREVFIDRLDEIPSGANTSTADTLVFRVRPPQELLGTRESDLEQIATTEVK